MKDVLLFVLLFLSPQLWAKSNSAPATAAAVKSFREWKSEKVAAAKFQVESQKSQIKQWAVTNPTPHTSAQKLKLKNLSDELSELQWNLEVASDLAVTDYVVLYLSQMNSKGSQNLARAAQNLSTQEVAEILAAYLKTNVTQTSGPSPIPPTAAQAPTRWER